MKTADVPILSVIIPVYNVEKYIERCVRSLFNQTLRNIEFIFVDDCTPDSSVDILASIIEEFRPHFAAMSWSVSIERMPTNSGLSAVRRHGIHLAQGKYIFHCDSDDWVEPDALAIMMDAALKSNADMVVCDFYRTNGDKYRTIESAAGKLDKETYLLDLLYQKYSWAIWNKMTKKEIYEKLTNYPKHAMGEDMVIVSQLVSLSGLIEHISEPLYDYYTNPNSIMNVTGKDISKKKFQQLKENTQVLLSFLDGALTQKKIKKVVPSLRFNMVLPLLPYVKEPIFRKIFNREIPSIVPFLINNRIFWRYRVLCILVKLRLYPISFK